MTTRKTKNVKKNSRSKKAAQPKRVAAKPLTPVQASKMARECHLMLSVMVDEVKDISDSVAEAVEVLQDSNFRLGEIVANQTAADEPVKPTKGGKPSKKAKPKATPKRGKKAKPVKLPPIEPLNEMEDDEEEEPEEDDDEEEDEDFDDEEE